MPQCLAPSSAYTIVTGFTPMALGGCIISTVGGMVLHRIPGTSIIILAGAAWIVAPLLFAVAPSAANYWAYTFPSMICATIAIDLTFTVTNIFVRLLTRFSQRHFRQKLISGSIIVHDQSSKEEARTRRSPHQQSRAAQHCHFPRLC